MAGNKAVKCTFIWAEKAAQPVELPQSGKPLFPPCQYFVSIALMSHVEQNVIVR